MRWNIYAVCFISLVAMQQSSAFAVSPVTMSGPTPAIQSSYSVGDNETYTYTVTNNTPVNFPLTVSGISGSVTRTTVANDCGNALSANSSCKIGLQIAPSVSDMGHHISQVLSVDYRGRSPLTSPIQFSVASSNQNLRFVAVGSNYEAGFMIPKAMILKSTGGSNWSSVASITGLSQDDLASLSQSACFGSGSSGICLAVGSSQTSGAPLVVRSVDGGGSWAVVNIPALSALNAVLSSVSCNGAGYCVATGYQTTETETIPLIIQSGNNGVTWSEASISGTDITGNINSLSCSGDVCVAGGSTVDTTLATLYQTVDGGQTWSKIDLTDLPSNYGTYFNSISCTGSGNDIRCVAIGSSGSYPSSVPFIVQTSGQSGNWTVVDTSSLLPNGGTLGGVSCTGSGDSAICAIAGSTNLSDMIMLQTVNGGESWQEPANPFTQQVAGSSVSCTGSGASAFCAWVGSDFDGVDQIPLLAQTTGTNEVWVSKTLPTLPNLGRGVNLASMACTGSGATAACIIGGGLNLIDEHEDQTSPLILQTINGGTSWSLQSVTGAPSISSIPVTSAFGG